MKVRGSLRRICGSCKLVKRGKKVFVVCTSSPKHKQRQGFSTLAGVDESTPLPSTTTCVPCHLCGGAMPADAEPELK